MDFVVTWSPQVCDDLHDIAAQIAKNSPRYASLVISRILAAGRAQELAWKPAALETEIKSRLATHESAIMEVFQRIMLLPVPSEGPEIPAKEMGFHATATKTSKS